MDPKKLKAIIEKRNALAEERNAIVEAAATETRALEDEEKTKVADFDEQIRQLDETIEMAKNDVKAADYEPVDNPDPETREAETQEEIEKREIADFAAYIRAEATNDQRAVTNLEPSKNGAVIPKTIAAKIIKKVVEISPIYAAASKYPVKGTLAIPYYDETSDRITVAWAEEFKALESHVGNFASIELSGHLAGTLAKISISLLNNSDFDLVSFVVDDMAEKIALFIEAKLLHTDDDAKVDGLKGVTIKVETAESGKITSDELIDLQESVIDQFQAGAFWIMNRKTRAAIRKLKDNEGRYMLNADITSPFGYVLLGKPVYTSDAMPAMVDSKPAIYYGDFSGLAVQEIENPSIQILRELFALEHAVGVVAWLEFDAKVEDAQKIAVLTMKAAE